MIPPFLLARNARPYPHQEKFCDNTQSGQMGRIDKLAGIRTFKQQIQAGASAAEIRKSREFQLSAYKKMRKKYILYPESWYRENGKA